MAPRKSKISKQKANSSVADDGEPLQPATKDVYRNGDLMLVVGEDFGPAHRFRVSRDAMCMASSVWRAMLSRDGQFSEATQKEVTFPDDNPEAFYLILQVAHLQFTEALKQMNIEDLVEVAILCDKYDTVAIVRPFIPGWVQPFLCEHTAVDCDDCGMGGMLIGFPAGNEEFLTVAWSFGYSNAFRMLSEQLLTTVGTNKLGQCVTQDGKILEEKKVSPDLTENLLAIRGATVLKMVKLYYEFFNKVLDKDNCKARPDHGSTAIYRDCCHALQLGRLIQAYQTFGQINPRRTDEEMVAASAEIYASISDIRRPLRFIDGMTFIEDSRHPIASHAACNFSNLMKLEIDEIIYEAFEFDVVQEAHRMHMKTQWKKGNLETKGSDDTG
ncbi:hypothetical protein BLS_005448 [Venturia inaequalis]|uniref:BTB domain-containing protein n=1 Tax=Venturia inaequalis TaxID=5025 RepID=A0A8H3UIE7_VENIN|nr:hypothetical protein BLS_005448 [Venturia inaequalis]